jgi:zinc-ribbon domain
MIYCSECGSENEDNADFCQNCGNLIKPDEKKEGFSQLINWKSLVFGAITFAVLFVLYLLLYVFNPSIGSSLVFGFLIIGPFISGIVTGYISGREFKSGILNGAIIGILYALIMGISAGLIAFLGGLLIFTVLEIIGGFIGVLVNKR